jgi:hypothetical protein
MFVPPRPKTPNGTAWMPVSGWGLIALIAFGLLLMRWMATDPDGFLRIVDDINLVIHEAGHPLFGFFGEQPMWFGGTLMELVVPAGIAIAFAYQRSALSAAFAGVWFFENFHYIGWYMADAKDMALPLAGGGEHDWNTIFTQYGVLDQYEQFSNAFIKIGYVGIVASLIFAVGVWYAQTRSNSTDDARDPGAALAGGLDGH